MDDRTYCKVRVFIAAKDGDIIATDERQFFTPPTTEEYTQLLFEEISFTDFVCYDADDIQYIISVLDWYAPDGAHSVFSMPLAIDDVWQDDFMTEEEDF